MFLPESIERKSETSLREMRTKLVYASLAIIVSIAALIFLFAGSEAKIDGSTEELYSKSLENIKRSLSEERKCDLTKAIGVVFFEEVKKRGSLFSAASNTTEIEESIRGRLDGKTASQIIEEWKSKTTSTAKNGNNLSADALDYIRKNISLYEITSKYFTNYVDEKVPGVDFKIKNNGDKSLSKVKVTVFFKDASGKRICEESYFPVNSNNSFRRTNPLKPGYIWSQYSGKFYTAKNVPDEWVEGSADFTISEIEFE